MIEFSTEEKAAIVSKIKDYFEAELDQDIGQFDAEFLLEFFVKEIGPFFYNKGVFDARGVFQSRLETIDEEIMAIEKDTSA
ncbi:MAG: DUF2164 domain-containing protein [Pyrinomonadaceae bacterium]|nr:DUF2164 domain-containing protein [Pyrinomonadaceae bacterium]